MATRINKTEFWNYAYSDFIDNRNRGALGEFIVAKACGVANSRPSSSWESYDITYDGIKIEVKTSSNIQTWKQNKTTSLQWGIAPKKDWLPEHNKWSEKVQRHADVYVFCKFYFEDIHDTVEANKAILNTDFWSFYVIATAELNEEMGAKKTISEKKLEQVFSCREVPFEGLSTEIKSKHKLV